MKGFDLNRISRIIKDIERFFTDLNEIKVNSVDDLENKEKFYAISMILFSIINRTIDLGDEIVASLDIGIPSTYRDIFYLLGKNRYIPDDLTKELFGLVYYRNLLSHEYYDFIGQDVFNILQKIGVVREFLEEIRKLVSKSDAVNSE